MSVRDKRLQADYVSMCDTFPNNGKIRIVSTSGNPVDKYQIEFDVNSLVMDPKGFPKFKTKHTAEIYLPMTYPRQAPQCRMLTPVFHPNIAPHAICIGDHWAIGESLPHLVVRIAEMLSYQSYNLKSPLNGDAAQWAEKNKIKLPTDKTDFSPYYENSHKTISNAEIQHLSASTYVKCVNCGENVFGSEIVVCKSHHPVCKNCAFTCKDCGSIICLKCVTGKCAVCGAMVCASCVSKCALCGNDTCMTHSKTCYICTKHVCDDCSIQCAVCGRSVCLDHLVKQPGTNNYICVNCAQSN